METQTYSKCKYCNEPVGKYEARCKYCASLLDWEEAQSEQASSKESPEDSINDAESNGLVRGQDFVLVDYTSPVGDKSINQNDEPYETNEVHKITDDNLRNKYSSHENIFVKNRTFISRKKPLSNTAKVWIAVICSIFPFVGQISGIIISINYINSNDADRRAYGSALLIPNMIIFVFNMFIFLLAIGLFLPI